MANVALKPRFRDGAKYGRVVNFLFCIQIVPPGTTGSMVVRDQVVVLSDRADDIALHNLHMVYIIQQLDPR